MSLFAGTAEHYERGRLPYAPGLDEVVAQLHPGDVGCGRLLDVGCGPGTLSFRLHHLFAEVVGIDPDPGMIDEARRQATESEILDVEFVEARAEELPLGLGTFTVAVFGQSFHWMDRHRVATTVYGMLRPGGVFILVSDRKNAPPTDTSGLADPAPPYDRIHELVRAHLGPVRRAGRGVLLNGTPDGEAAVMAQIGFEDPERIVIPAGQILVRTADGGRRTTLSPGSIPAQTRLPRCSARVSPRSTSSCGRCSTTPHPRAGSPSPSRTARSSSGAGREPAS